MDEPSGALSTARVRLLSSVIVLALASFWAVLYLGVLERSRDTGPMIVLIVQSFLVLYLVIGAAVGHAADAASLRQVE